MVGRTKTAKNWICQAAAILCAMLLGISGIAQEAWAQSAWGGNNSVTVNESVLNSLGPATSSPGVPYQPQAGAYGGSYTRYGGALLFPPQQTPRSALTVPPPSAQALRGVPPVPRSAPRATASVRAQPSKPSVAVPPAAQAQQFPARQGPQTAAQAQQFPARQAPQTAAQSQQFKSYSDMPPAARPQQFPPPAAPQAAAQARQRPAQPAPQAAARPQAPAPPPPEAKKPKQQPAATTPQVLAPPPPPPPAAPAQPAQPKAAQPVAKAQPPKPKDKPAPQTASTAPAATNGTPQAETGASSSLDEMDLPPPAPLPTLSDAAEPMIPTVGLDSSEADEPRKTLFSGGPSPTGIVSGGAPTKPVAPAAPPPPPPTPEPVSADDAKQAAPLATSTPKPQAPSTADSTVAAAPQPPSLQQESAPKPTQQAALTPATAPSGNEVRVPFQPAQINLEEKQQALLAPLADQLNSNEQMAVRVQAYASGEASDPNKARRLSLQRALKVRKYFIDQGIRSVRVEVRALGMSGPDGSVDRVDVVPVQR